jgi:flagellar hook-associated protein 3 FlgL
MTMRALSDLASHLLRQGQVSRTRTQLEAAGKEMTTGQVSDLRAATGGDIGKLFAIDRSLALLTQRQSSLKLADGKTSVVQDRLAEFRETTESIGTNLLAAVERGDMVSAGTYALEAKHKVEQLMSALNSTYQGKSLFSGAAEDRPAVAHADVLLGQVEDIVTSATDMQSAISSTRSYFLDAGGGFEAQIYVGSSETAPPVALDEAVRAGTTVKADHPAIRNVLMSLAIAATVSTAGDNLNADDRAALLTEAGTAMVSAKEGVIELSAELGMVQGQIAEALSRNGNDLQSLELARNEIVGVDAYEAASRFTALEGQLQSMYAVTARLSALNLTNFLK